MLRVAKVRFPTCSQTVSATGVGYAAWAVALSRADIRVSSIPPSRPSIVSYTSTQDQMLFADEPAIDSTGDV